MTHSSHNYVEGQSIGSICVTNTILQHKNYFQIVPLLIFKKLSFCRTKAPSQCGRKAKRERKRCFFKNENVL